MSRSLLALHAPSANASALSAGGASAVGGMKPPIDSHDWRESGSWRRDDGGAREGVSRVGANWVRKGAGGGRA